MNRMTSTIFGIFLILILAVPALAANQGGTYTLTPLVGGYLFEGQQNVERNAPTLGLALGYNFDRNLGTEATLQYINANTNRGGGKDINGYLYRIDGIYHFFPGNMVVPYLAAGFGGLTLNPYFNEEETNGLFDWGGGLKIYGSDNLALRLDVRHLLVFDHPENNLAYTAGLMYQFGGAQPAPAKVVPPADSDGDGILDSEDKCPGTPAGVRVDKTGCRPDSDGDGVFDDLDKCPGTPAGVRVDTAGCRPDSDGDGVFDDLDKCPGTPAGVRVDTAGCRPDSDGDGVFDDLDKCPGTQAGIPVDQNGCRPDSDGDGVFDDLDKCPETPAGELVDKTGCTLKLTLHIKFDSNKTEIKPEFKDDISRTAAFIRANPNVPYFVIAGYTDSMGDATYNQRLSERRAAEVRDALIRDYGLSPDKIHARGYGETKPVASNETAAGRYENRRVEIICCAVLPQ
ncbi:OmpA family protein [Desulfuromonas carbonis]